MAEDDASDLGLPTVDEFPASVIGGTLADDRRGWELKNLTRVLSN